MTDNGRVPDAATLPELTFRGIVLGALITIVFTASNVFLGLKVGLTFSSAIPAAVISMAVLRFFSGANILENTMVQTQASAAGSLSSIIFVLPALLMMGHWQGFPFWQTVAICAAGGMLGVLFSIPLRHLMVVQSDLPYPEGVAAAEILRAGKADRTQAALAAQRDRSDEARQTSETDQTNQSDWTDQSDEAGQISGIGSTSASVQTDDVDAHESGIRQILAGGLVAAAVSFAASGLRVLSDGISGWYVVGASVFRLPMGFSMALLGAGYLIGIVSGLAMLLGLVIAWGVAVPMLTSITVMPSNVSIQSFAQSVWSDDVRFIGAGVIGVGAIWTLAVLVKPMWQGLKTSLSTFSGNAASAGNATPRTEQDLSMRWILPIVLVLVAVLVVAFRLFIGPAPLTTGAIWSLVGYSVAFTVIFGFLVAAACGYMAGLVGSSASPISGIGIVAMVLVSVMMLLLSRGNGLLASAENVHLAIALAIFTVSAVLTVASISNDNLQDLKTGWLVGATPWRQQVALLIGCVVGAAVIAPVLDLLYNAYGFADALPRAGMDASEALSAPQATLMLAIARGIFTHQLNWLMISIGAAIGVAIVAVDAVLKRTCAVARLPVLAVGIGIYLPPNISSALVAGAFLSWLIDRLLQRRAARHGGSLSLMVDRSHRRGVLIASGLIVGESLVGVAMAGIIGAAGVSAPLAIVGPAFAQSAQWLGLIVFVTVAIAFCRRVIK
jgi:putative OPT family oligopeptide transporter